MPDRQAALAALRDQLTLTDRDLAPILRPEAARAAEDLRAAVPDPDSDLEVAHALGWYHWLRYQALPEGLDQEALAAAARYLMPVYLTDAEAVPEPLGRFFEDQAANDPETDTDATAMARLAIDAITSYQRTGQRELLDQSVALFRAALAATPEDHPAHAGRQNDLGGALRMLFARTGELDALVEAVDLARAAVDATPADHRDRAGFLSNLGSVLQMLFGHTEQQGVLVEAVDALREAVDATREDHPDRATRLGNLGIALQRLFARTGQQGALAEAVTVGRQAVDATAGDHPGRAMHLSILGNALRTLYERTGRQETLDEAVTVGRQAVGASTDEDPGRASYLNNLGITLQTLYQRTGELEMLAEAVDLARAAVDATAEDAPDLASHLSNLGFALETLFERTGELDELIEAVAVGRQAVAASTEDHPDHAGRADCLSNLGIALQALFERTGELEALAEAVDLARAAVDATPEDHPDRAMYLGNLGNALQTLFERTERQDVLAEAVTVALQAVEATPANHPDRAGRLNSLGNVLRTLFEHTGQQGVLFESVDALRAAVAGTPEDHPDRASRLSNLGGTLRVLFGHTGQQEALIEAVAVGRQAVDAASEDHPSCAMYLTNLGHALQTLFAHTGQRDALAEARHTYRDAASSTQGSMIARITAYRQLALLAQLAGDVQDGLRCAEAAIDLVEVLAPGSLARADREHQLGRLANLAGEAAAAALNAGQPTRAVELLERTRGILAADTLGLRGDDLTRLHADQTHGHLADQVEQLRERLDTLDQPRRAFQADTSARGTAQQAAQTNRHLSGQRREAHTAWQSLLEEIRAVPGFADFFRAPPIADLARRAHDGPIVFVTAGPTRADALVLADSPEPVHVVPLAGLTQATAREQVNRLLATRLTTTDPTADPAVRQSAQREIRTVLAWLWDTIAEPILTHLGHTTTPTGDAPWPRVWWCPVGILAYLPLHAAGHHTRQTAEPALPRTVPDLVVSSYTPTVRALAQARTPRSADPISAALIVPVQEIPGAELPGVTTETNAIIALMPGAHVLDQPTRDSVLAALPAHRITHFSCHGYADWEQPARSRLILTDHATTPLTLADIIPLRLDADLAFLSACDTAVTAPRLVDESLHITAAFHLAGYRHVIGTLWPIDDLYSAQITEDFYARLTTDGTTVPNPACAAHALHHATTRLRDQYPQAPTLWASHTHTGA